MIFVKIDVSKVVEMGRSTSLFRFIWAR